MYRSKEYFENIICIYNLLSFEKIWIINFFFLYGIFFTTQKNRIFLIGLNYLFKYFQWSKLINHQIYYIFNSFNWFIIHIFLNDSKLYICIIFSKYSLLQYIFYFFFSFSYWLSHLKLCVSYVQRTHISDAHHTF